MRRTHDTPQHISSFAGIAETGVGPNRCSLSQSSNQTRRAKPIATRESSRQRLFRAN